MMFQYPASSGERKKRGKVVKARGLRAFYVRFSAITLPILSFLRRSNSNIEEFQAIFFKFQYICFLNKTLTIKTNRDNGYHS